MSGRRMPPEVAAAVFARDRVCIGYRLNPRHICKNQWGRSHAPDDRRWLTLDHVHRDGGTMGKRAEDDVRHLVVMCFALNVGVPSKDLRAAERAYLTEVAP